MSRLPGEVAEILLAMETSGDVCGVAVLRAGQPCAEHTFRHGMHLSERLLDHLEGVLREADTALAEVTAFAVGIGPGSFTGTRIGVMTIKTLAALLERPVYGIGGLDALAMAYSGLRETAVVPILPCRAGTVFTAAFTVADSRPEPLFTPAALPVTELAARLRSLAIPDLLICGVAVERYRAELAAALEPERLVSFGAAEFPAASAVGLLAWQRRVTGDPPDDPLTLVPSYISPPPITVPRSAIPLPANERKNDTQSCATQQTQFGSYG